MDKDENDVCLTEMLVDLTIEERVSSELKLCSETKFASNTARWKISKNSVVDKMQKCIKDMDQCIMDMSPASLKAECRISQSDSTKLDQDKVDATASDCPLGILVDLPSPEIKDSKELSAKSLTGCRLKASSVNVGTPPLIEKMKQLSVARRQCKIPSPQSMSHINKEASKVINNLNTSFMFDENVFLTEEILPIPINFDLDDTDSEDNLSNTEDNVCKHRVLNSKTSIAIQTNDIYVSDEINNEENMINKFECDAHPEDNLSNVEENICKTEVLKVKTIIAPESKEISINMENYEKGVINLYYDATDLQDNLPSVEENSCKSEILNNKISVVAQKKVISVDTESSVSTKSVLNNSDHHFKPDVLQNSKIEVSGTPPSRKQSEIIKKSESSVESNPCKIGESIESSDSHLSHYELDNVFTNENLLVDKIKTELPNANQKCREIAQNKFSSKLRFGTREKLKNLSNIRCNVTGTDSLMKRSPNISNKPVISTQIQSRIQHKELIPKPFSREKIQLKKTVSAIEPRNAPEIIRSGSFQFASRTELISNLEKRSSTKQDTSEHQQSGIMQPKIISKTSSSETPSRRYSITTPFKNSCLKPPMTPEMSKYPKPSIPRFTPQRGSRLSFSKSLQFPSRSFHGLRQPNPSSLRKSKLSEEQPSCITTPPKIVKRIAAVSTSSKKRNISRLDVPSPLPAYMNENLARNLFPAK